MHWLRWTIIGCLAWIAIVLIVGMSSIALILTPVIGPLGGWLVGGVLYLLGGAFERAAR